MQNREINWIANPVFSSEDESSRFRIDRERAKQTLASDFGITSAFVRVGVLAKVLGISQPTIYVAIRRGSFFLPVRTIGSTPLVKFDDFVDWYCRPNQHFQDGASQAEAGVAAAVDGAAPCERFPTHDSENLGFDHSRKGAKEIRDDVVAGVLARMREQNRG